jgi:N-acetylglucosamine kinase-like BadF-type ATPase
LAHTAGKIFLVAFFLGIDGGGSKTRCVLGDEQTLLASGSSSGCNVLRVGEACAQSSLQAAIHEACVQAGVSARVIMRTCAGVAGCGRREIAEVLRRVIAGIVGGEVEVTGDTEIAFEAAFGSRPGVMIISGTGSMAYGKNARGEAARAGGWGHAISDEGSGHWIGVAAIREAMRFHDRGESPGLLQDLIAAVGAKSVEELVVTVNKNPEPDFAALFPVVLAAAEAGDPVADVVLKCAGGELAELAHTVIRRLFNGAAQVGVAAHGGVLTSSARVKDSLVERLRAQWPEVDFVCGEVYPAGAALERARRGTGRMAAGPS